MQYKGKQRTDKETNVQGEMVQTALRILILPPSQFIGSITCCLLVESVKIE